MPFAAGYLQAREAAIRRAIGDPAVLARFSAGRPLPRGFGRYLDERVVEYPWAFGRLRHLRPTALLDVGPCLNYAFCITWLRRHCPQSEVTMLSLTPDPRCFYDEGVSYQLSDARDLPYRTGRFDVVTCMSTLEHIGMDNTKYGHRREFAPHAYLDAVGEIRRVLRPGGTGLFTVPYGAYSADDLLGSQQRFDADLLDALIERFRPRARTLRFFRYSPTGWTASTQRACGGATYTSTTFATLDDYRAQPVRAEAVACLAVRK